MKELSADLKSIGQSISPIEEKLKVLKNLFPEAFSEGRLDTEVLKRALGEGSVIEENERYGLNWAGKSAAYKVLQAPTTSTLRPQRDLSINFDNAQHVFIEGENLEVLKVIQKAYFGQIKLIYIDPPYNTGSDSFIYPDRYQESKEEYLKRINDLSDDGTLMREGYFRKNTKENGHFHSNWLSMMLPRLYIARNLLREDGLIFVSCDDNEVHNLRLLMDEVFGEENFVSQIIVQSNKRGQTYKDIAKTHEYLLVYSRTEDATLFELPKDDDALPYEDSIGKYDLWELRNRNPKFGRHNRENLWFPIYVAPSLIDSDGYARVSLEKTEEYYVEVYPQNSQGKDGCWRWSKSKILLDGGLNSELPVIVAKQKRDGGWNIYEKSRKSTTKPKSIWDETEVINEQGTVQLGELGLGGYFDHPKPKGLIEKIVKIATEADDIILDFFCGSGTTMDAVINLNVQEKTDRRVICVQLPEKCDEDSEAFKAGFRTIADLSRERIRRAIEKVKAERDTSGIEQGNLGFKSFVLAPSNFKQWRGDGIETEEQLVEQIEMFINPVKDGAETEHILYELLLKFGHQLTTAIEVLPIEGTKVFAVNNRSKLFVIEHFNEKMIEHLLALKPNEIITLDLVFYGNDELKTNFELQCRDADVRFICI